MFPKEVQAAGGVIVANGRIAVVHRPYREDWSLPKGKLDPGETFEHAAVREIEEETGLHVDLGDELAPVRYADHRGRPKVVRYWLMTATGGAFAANDEVDELRWLAPAEAIALLTYENDHEVVREAARRLELAAPDERPSSA
ncbi:NUDIX hydrolase [Patulibacter brassicae]|uniref:NUDIX hydrolase n=1 Tax=Patulibacter brassicae TaxID=1705717 RepID=A0ABU4VIT8_9ACTN|nr:NUDIX hydrolase [Patulibacter brassicae]MDX8151054.1 NUDIX hydrolase [Patulibacter brassicae]